GAGIRHRDSASRTTGAAISAVAAHGAARATRVTAPATDGLREDAAGIFAPSDNGRDCIQRDVDGPRGAAIAAVRAVCDGGVGMASISPRRALALGDDAVGVHALCADRGARQRDIQVAGTAPGAALTRVS